MSSVLITGISGFLGINAAKQFKNLGYSVYGIDKCILENKTLVKNFLYEPVNIENLSKFKNKFELIIHCAGGGSVGYSIANPADDYQMNVSTLLEMLEYIRKNQNQASLIYPSSAAVYGSQNDELINENTKLNPVSPYGFNKLIAEKLCESYAKNYKLKIGIIRYFSIYGNGLKKQLIWDTCKKLSKNNDVADFYGSGLETRDFIHIDDAVRLMKNIAEIKDNFLIVNGSSGIAVKIKEAIQLIKTELNNNSLIKFNNIAKTGDPMYYHGDNTKAKSLGWYTKISLKEGIKDYVIWYKNLIKD